MINDEMNQVVAKWKDTGIPALVGAAMRRADLRDRGLTSGLEWELATKDILDAVQAVKEVCPALKESTRGRP